MPKLRRCEKCRKYKRVLYKINDEEICAECVRGMAFYQAFKESFKDPKYRGDVITVGIDIGNAVWFNPFSYAWLYPLSLWMVSKDIGARLIIEKGSNIIKLVTKDNREYTVKWRYKKPLDDVLRLYQEEAILKVIDEGDELVLTEGETLNEMLKKYGDRPDAFEIIDAWVSGLIIARLHEEADAPDFRLVDTLIQVIANEMIDNTGDITAESYSKVTGYKCRLCGLKFTTREEVKSHLMTVHRTPSDEIMGHIEEESITTGYLLDIYSLVKALTQRGVRPETFFERMERLGVAAPEDPDTPRVIERDGRKFVVIDPSWVRIVARAKIYERGLVLGRGR